MIRTLVTLEHEVFAPSAVHVIDRAGSHTRGDIDYVLAKVLQGNRFLIGDASLGWNPSVRSTIQHASRISNRVLLDAQRHQQTSNPGRK
jgi:ethanolamine ammonia-lyase large subunit